MKLTNKKAILDIIRAGFTFPIRGESFDRYNGTYKDLYKSCILDAIFRISPLFDYGKGDWFNSAGGKLLKIAIYENIVFLFCENKNTILVTKRGY